MKRQTSAVAMVTLGLLLMVSACGKKDAAPGASTAAEAPSAEAAPAKQETPQVLAKAAFVAYEEGLTQLVEMAATPPALADAKKKATALHEAAVGKLVAIGKKREAMSDADKKAFSRSLLSAMRDTDKGAFAKLNTLVTHYRAEDNEFANLLASFNIITQYCDFDLLRKQRPEEMKRLGLE